jgi:glycosyltransferase involved in cell wall biosynthesis
MGVPRFYLKEWSKAGRINSWLAKIRPAAVIIHGYNDVARLRVFAWCRRHRIPILLSGDSNILGDRGSGWRSFFKRFLLRLLVRNAAAFLSFGSLGAAYFRRYGANSGRTFFFPLEPDYALIESMPPSQVEAVRTRYDFSAPRRRILYSGRLAQVKRVDVLLDAFATFAQGHLDWDLVILGSGPLKEQLMRLSSRLPQDRVKWIESLRSPQDVFAVYCCCHVFVLLSDHEPWGLVINEATAAGMAIICTNVVGAAPELVSQDVNGVTVPPGDAIAVVRALEDITKAERLRNMQSASPRVAKKWRETGDPVQGLRQALSTIGIIRKAKVTVVASRHSNGSRMKRQLESK